MRATTLNGVAFTNTSLPTLALPNPATLFGANLLAWLKADLGVTEASNLVSGWNDQSGAGLALGVAGTPSPTFVPTAQNGKPAITGVGTSYLGASNHSSPLAFEYNNAFSVMCTFTFHSNISKSSQWLIGQVGATPNFRGWVIDLGVGNPAGRFQLTLSNVFATTQGAVAPMLTMVEGTTYSIVLTYDGLGTTSSYTAYVNGQPVALARNTAIGTNTIVDSASKFGVHGSSAGAGNGDLQTLLEAIVVNRVITAAEAATLFQYTNFRYAIL